MTDMQSFPAELSPLLVDRAVQAALDEDLGLAGDLTGQATLAPDARARAVLNAREPGVLCGLALVEAAFRLAGPDARFTPLAEDGATIRPGQDVAIVEGRARTIMAGERVGLNFLNHLSGIATATRAFVEAVSGTGTRICDTRKTLPGLRAFAKYAVRCGGGANHRYGLGDAILIKDNHIAVAGGVGAAVEAARRFAGHMVVVEVEVDGLEQLREALSAGATAVLLDNMDNAALAEAVRITAGRARLEASGGVTLERVRSIAETGVDYISTSRITMAAPPLDLGLDIRMER